MSAEDSYEVLEVTDNEYEGKRPETEHDDDDDDDLDDLEADESVEELPSAKSRTKSGESLRICN
jgi:hypothetical protein